ncbi:hypothetical protein [Cesiribacter andamanensis]|uniref:hypothetical protein n=1 Tax=Cesiribacter andamanensis TaxID=649507 RepID=UPI001378412F|nr:hypothetical protein [Cesiribacter andamanensis]
MQTVQYELSFISCLPDFGFFVCLSASVLPAFIQSAACLRKIEVLRPGQADKRRQESSSRVEIELLKGISVG